MAYADYKLDEYQQLAARTLNDSLTPQGQLNNAALGLCGEAGEFTDLVKKHLFHGAELPREKALKELGDVLWYVAAACTALQASMGEVAQLNIDKLRARHPNGFTHASAQAKADEK